MSTKKQTVKTPKAKASDIFVLAAITFLLLLVEPLINTVFNVPGFTKTIIARAVCVVIWAFGAKALINMAKKDCSFNVFTKEKTLSTLQWIIISVVAAAVLGYFIWNKFSIIQIIYHNLKAPKVVVAYISMLLLNTAKAFVLTVFIAFVQKGFSLSFKAGKYIPFGGIVLGLIWCVMFLFSNNGIWDSTVAFNWIYLVYQFLYGLVLGVFFVLADNKTRYALPFILGSTLFIFLT